MILRTWAESFSILRENFCRCCQNCIQLVCRRVVISACPLELFVERKIEKTKLCSFRTFSKFFSAFYLRFLSSVVKNAFYIFKETIWSKAILLKKTYIRNLFWKSSEKCSTFCWKVLVAFVTSALYMSVGQSWAICFLFLSALKQKNLSLLSNCFMWCCQNCIQRVLRSTFRKSNHFFFKSFSYLGRKK